MQFLWSRPWGVVTPLVATLLLLGGCRSWGSATPTRRTGSSAAGDPAATPGSWRRIDPAPIPPAGGMAAAWTGRQLVIWGGQTADGHEPGQDGAAYDPAADRWDVLPPAPIAGRFGASAVWTGREVLFWGGQPGPATTLADGAAYDPVTRRWRTLPAAPIGPRTSHQAVWTGREMVVWGGYARCCPIDSVLHDPAAASYDPSTDQWRRIASVPPPWSGDDGTAVTVVDHHRALIWRRGHLVAYDGAADTWNEPEAPPEPLPGDPALPATTADPFALATVAGGEVFTWAGKSGELQGLAWQAGNGTWRRTETLEVQAGGAMAAGPPGRIYAAAGQSARVLEYEIAADRWEELPLPPISTRSAAVLVWTGSELLLWGGIGDESPEMDGAAWRPEP
jgi:hypothetical protein